MPHTDVTDSAYSQVIGHTSARSTSSFRAENLFGPYPKPMADEIMSGMKLSNAPKEMISALGEAICLLAEAVLGHYVKSWFVRDVICLAFVVDVEGVAIYHEN